MVKIFSVEIWIKIRQRNKFRVVKLSVISYRGNGEAGHNQNEDREQLHVSGLDDTFELRAVKLKTD